MVYHPRKFSDVTKNARDIKVNGIAGMENFDVAIWHDSSVRLHVDKLSELAKVAETNMLSAFHHVRYCAYLEAIACIDQNKDAALRITAQMYRYFREGFPANNKLHETTIMVINCAEFMKSQLQTIWWNEIEHRSRRDQLSLSYARWKTNTEVGLLDHWQASGFKNDYSTWIGHKHARYDHKNPLFSINSRLIKLVCKKLIFEMRKRR